MKNLTSTGLQSSRRIHGALMVRVGNCTPDDRPSGRSQNRRQRPCRRPTPSPRDRSGLTPAVAAANPPALAAARTSEMTRILVALVDAIDIRESYEPELSGWDLAHTIRRLERELARAWSALPAAVDAPSAARRWQP